MTRYVQPGWFFAETTRIDWAGINKGVNAPTSTDDLSPTQLLRWALHPDVGLPVSPFTVWARPENPKTDPAPTKVELAVTTVTANSTADVQLPTAAWRVTVVVDTPSGSLQLNAYDGQGGRITGVTVDSGAAGLAVPLTGSGIVRIVASGSGKIDSITYVSVAVFANLPDWTPVEVVGLPVDPSQPTGSYSSADQGLSAAPVAPDAAAISRLQRAAPRLGWPAPAGTPGPIWAAPDSTALVGTYQQTIVADLIKMLMAVPDATNHASYRIDNAIPDPFDQRGIAPPPENKLGPSTASVPPLGLLALACHGDPYAALSLGFATGYPRSAPTLSHLVPTTDYMVSVPHKFTVRFGPSLRYQFDGELAAFFAPVPPHRPAPPGNLSSSLAIGGARPGGRDAPRVSSVVLGWDRPDTTAGSMQAVSDVVARTSPGAGALPDLLVATRPDQAAVPFVPAVPLNATPGQANRVTFTDGGFPDPAEPTGTYRFLVCGQNRWGLWSDWAQATSVPPDGVAQAPILVNVALEFADLTETGTSRAATVSIDVSWDWHDRTPTSIDIVAVFIDPTLGSPVTPPADVFAPAGVVTPLTVQWASDTVDSPTPSLPGTTVTRLEPSPTTIAPGQPPDDVGRYRVEVPVTLDFSSGADMRIACWIRGTQRFDGLTSGWSTPRAAGVSNPVPPVPPGSHGPLVWTSLPDALGVSRAHLTWTPVAGVDYVVYHADETALLALVGQPAADLSVSLPDRALALDTAVHIEHVRDAFRRVTSDPIDGGSYEVELPRKSEVLHGFVVLGRSAAGVESSWPTTPPAADGGRGYTLMAVPRIDAPAGPGLAASTTTTSGQVRLLITPPPQPAARIDIHRTAVARLAFDIGTMGPAVASISAPPGGFIGPVEQMDSVAPSWRPYVYRAVAWGTDDDTLGLRAAQGTPSAPQAAMVVPPGPPLVSGAVILAAVGTVPSYVRFSTDAPPIRTPSGPFALLVAITFTEDGSGNPSQSVVRTTLDALPVLTGDPGADATWYIGVGFIGTDGSVGIVLATGNDTTVQHVRIVLTDPLGRAQPPVEIEVT